MARHFGHYNMGQLKTGQEKMKYTLFVHRLRKLSAVLNADDAAAATFNKYPSSVVRMRRYVNLVGAQVIFYVSTRSDEIKNDLTDKLSSYKKNIRRL